MTPHRFKKLLRRQSAGEILTREERQDMTDYLAGMPPRMRIRKKVIAKVKRTPPRVAEYYRNRARAHRKEIVEFLGDCCVRCGFTDARALQIDHVNGGGRKHYRSIGHSTERLYAEIREHPEEYQLLCANCNRIKCCENDEMLR